MAKIQAYHYSVKGYIKNWYISTAGTLFIGILPHSSFPEEVRMFEQMAASAICFLATLFLTFIAFIIAEAVSIKASSLK